MCEDSDGYLPGREGLSVSDTTTWEWRNRCISILSDIRGTLKDVAHQHQPNIGFLVDYMIRMQQRASRFGAYNWRYLGDPRDEGTYFWFYRIGGEISYVPIVREWLLATRANDRNTYMDWSKLPEMIDSMELFVSYRTPSQ